MVCISYNVICNILFNGAATSGIGLQCPAPTNAGLIALIELYFYRVLAIAILSVRLFVCPSIRHTGGSVKSGAS